MFDLPSVNLDPGKLEREIVELRRGKREGHYRPHKLVMLLAVIELAEKGLLNENKIFLAHPLIQAFENIFLLVKSQDDLCQVGPPFFHLRTSGFWFHQVRPGRESDYAKLTTTGGGLQIIELNIEYAYLREDVCALVTDPMSRKDLRLFISGMLNAGRD
jgi:predicted restriction endonuclease